MLVYLAIAQQNVLDAFFHKYDVLADFDFFMIMKILNIDDTCISIKLILHYTTSTAVPTDWVTRVYLYTLLIIYFHKFHFMKNAFKKT